MRAIKSTMITVEWDNPERTILYTRYTDAWTWAEYEQALEDMGVLLNSVTHPVAIIRHIVDVEALLPPAELYTLPAHLQWFPANWGGLVILAPDPLVVKSFAALALSILGEAGTAGLYAAPALEDARTLAYRLLAEAPTLVEPVLY
jgi:hypothetical protein